MMKWTRYMLMLPVLMVQALSSCSLIDDPESDDNSPVEASLAFTVSSSAKAITRMSDDVVQEQQDKRRFRGLGKVYIIPFAISGDNISSTDHPSRLFQDASQTSSKLPTMGDYGGFYLYNIYTLVRGINSFLVYGRASTTGLSVPSGVTSKAYFGSLQVPESELIYPDMETLRFTPDPIYNNTTAPAEAQVLAGYLTYIARAEGWSTTTDETLKLLYKVFTGQENDGTMVLAGASVNVMAHVNALYDLISQLSFSGSEATIKKNILYCIKNYTATGLSLACNNDGKVTKLKLIKEGKDVDYPAALGLPDGAAAMRWAKMPNSENYGFVPQTVTTTLANINNIDRWCYPPELFYYANSRIDTSNEEITSYNSAPDNWATLLEDYYKNKNAMVTGNTKGVAIQQPLQYAVGRFKATLQKVTTTLKDDAGKTVSLTNSSSSPSFPLTGIIICNQHPVGFDFKPVLDNGAASHAYDHFIYDSQVGSSCYLSTADDHNIPSTLVLQSYDKGEGEGLSKAEEVTIAMEFRNDSGAEFRGKDGVIYPGTKFYLMGKIDPTKGSTTDTKAQGRVFTQDYITTITTTVNSLANAYNVLPNMLGGRLELGVELTPAWIQAETTNVILE